MSKLSRTIITIGLILSLAGPAAQSVSAQGITIAQLFARAGKQWLPTYNPKTDWNFTHASTAAKKVCLRSETVPIPRGELPTAAELPKLASCNSEALYYGFAGKPHYVRARQCAYLERALGDRNPISGSAVLSMIYANGVGARRNLALATKFACEAGGAPAEINGRISHLQRLAARTAPPRRRFGFCDDITSGYMTGVCAAAAEGILEGRRKVMIERIASRYTSAQKAAFEALQYVARTYYNLRKAEEVDFSGSAGHAFEIDDFVHGEKTFLNDVEALNANRIPASQIGGAREADGRLEAIYHRVLANPALRPAGPDPLLPGLPMTEAGTITREGLRVDQALWLSYRDAWVHFAASVKPALSGNAVRIWITNQRINNLRCLLPIHDKDFRRCNIPLLSPSTVHP
jgi:hypothetical protein